MISPADPSLPHLLRRAWRSSPLVVLTISFLLGTIGLSLPGLDRQWLTQIYMLEFLAIHSFPFMIIVLSWRAPTDKTKGIRIVAVLLLAWIYSLGAYSIAEWQGVLALFPLMVGTYFGYLLKGISRDLLPELAVRGGINFLCFILCAIVFDLPSQVDEWDGMREVVWAGMAYFGFLSFVELKGWPERWGQQLSTSTKKESSEKPSVGPSLQIPTTFSGVHSAVAPLLASGGLAIAPYALVPFVAGWIGRTIEDFVGWQYDDDLNRLWYFVLYVPVFAIVRSWQVRQVLGKNDKVFVRRVSIGTWVVFAILGALSFFTGDSMEVDELWTLENLFWVVVVDVPVLLLLVPMVWIAVGRGDGS